jgi:hypothetical protein
MCFVRCVWLNLPLILVCRFIVKRLSDWCMSCILMIFLAQQALRDSSLLNCERCAADGQGLLPHADAGERIQHEGRCASRPTVKT